MLIRFTVSNYRSLRDPQELSLVASRLKEPHDPVIRLGEMSLELLRTAAIYGANASGKTTVLRALQYLATAVEDSHRAWKPDQRIPYEPFLLDEKTKTQPSTFEIDFFLRGVRYQFGFHATATEFVKEWLYTFPNGRKQVWYERESGSKNPIKFGKNFSGENRAIESLTRPNSLYISAAAQNNHEMLLPVFSWLTKSIEFEFGSRAALSPNLAAASQVESERGTTGTN